MITVRFKQRNDSCSWAANMKKIQALVGFNTLTPKI